MQRLSPSIRIYVGLIVLLAALGALNAFLPQGSYSTALSDQALPASKPVIALVTAATLLVLYGGLGFVGLQLSQRMGFSPLWSPDISQRRRFVIPAYIGLGTGAFFVLADAILSRMHALGSLPHPPFPTSIVASVTAGIGEEAIFRLFFIPFWVWLISSVILRGRWRDGVFWVVSVWSALAFALGHLPSVIFALGLEGVSAVPAALMAEIILLNGALSLLAAAQLRRSGFLAAVGVHFWADIAWHVVWGLLS
jgi:hypothetical protein